MSKKQNENKVKESVQKYLDSLGAYHIKEHGSIYMRAGIPDIICCYKGRFIGIETKDGDNKASELQLAHGRKIKRNDGIFIIAYSVEDVRKEFKKCGLLE